MKKKEIKDLEFIANGVFIENESIERMESDRRKRNRISILRCAGLASSSDLASEHLPTSCSALKPSTTSTSGSSSPSASDLDCSSPSS